MHHGTYRKPPVGWKAGGVTAPAAEPPATEPPAAEPAAADPARPAEPAPPTGTPATRWEQQVVGERWTFYADRFAKLTQEGADLDGEARFVDAMAGRGSDVLDAGCGTGRVAAALQRMGHRSIGVDKDAGLVDIAIGRYPGVPYLAHDLLTLNAQVLEAAGAPQDFDIVVLAGNVMVYLAPGTERSVLGNLSALLRPGGRIVAGFATGRDYGPDDLDTDAAALGLTLECRFGTWLLDPFRPGSDWMVVVLRSGTAPGTADSATWAPASTWPGMPG